MHQIQPLFFHLKHRWNADTTCRATSKLYSPLAVTLGTFGATQLHFPVPNALARPGSLHITSQTFFQPSKQHRRTTAACRSPTSRAHRTYGRSSFKSHPYRPLSCNPNRLRRQHPQLQLPNRFPYRHVLLITLSPPSIPVEMSQTAPGSARTRNPHRHLAPPTYVAVQDRFPAHLHSLGSFGGS